MTLDEGTVAAAARDGESRTAIARLGTVPIFVTDQDRALTFYRDALGFEVIVDQPIGNGSRWLALARAPGETELLLYRPGMYGESPDALSLRVGSWTGIVFLTDDIKEGYRTLAERGVEFAGDPEPQPWGGWETSFSDPDGNRFQLTQRPGWM